MPELNWQTVLTGWGPLGVGVLALGIVCRSLWNFAVRLIDARTADSKAYADALTVVNDKYATLVASNTKAFEGNERLIAALVETIKELRRTQG